MNKKFMIRFASLFLCVLSGLPLTVNAYEEDNSDFEKSKLEEVSKTDSTQNKQEPTKLINVPYINQNDIVYGCEAVSATMLLNYFGYKVSEKEFTDKYLLRKNWYIGKDGKAYGPDPNAAYPGDPYKSGGVNCGFGSFAPSTAKSIKRVLDNQKHKVLFSTDLNLDEITKKYIDKDIPVLIWATMDMLPTTPGYSWIINYIDENSKLKKGDKFTWKNHEHCLVLVGYDDKSYYFNDPYKNHGLISYKKELVKKRFSELGNQSVVILKNK